MKKILFTTISFFVLITSAYAQYDPQPLKHNFYLDEFKQAIDRIDARERYREEQESIKYRQREAEQRRIEERNVDEKSVWFGGLSIGDTWEQAKQTMSRYGEPYYIDSYKILYSSITTKGVTFHGIELYFNAKKLYKISFIKLFGDEANASLLCDMLAKDLQLIKQDTFDNVLKVYAGPFKDVVSIVYLMKKTGYYEVDILVMDPKDFYGK